MNFILLCLKMYLLIFPNSMKKFLSYISSLVRFWLQQLNHEFFPLCWQYLLIDAMTESFYSTTNNISKMPKCTRCFTMYISSVFSWRSKNEQVIHYKLQQMNDSGGIVEACSRADWLVPAGLRDMKRIFKGMQ